MIVFHRSASNEMSEYYQLARSKLTNITMSLAVELDKKFPSQRRLFDIPTFKKMGLAESDNEVIYFCGNSLGLMPKATRQAIDNELDCWGSRGVFGHHTRNDQGIPWVINDVDVSKRLARIVFGCNESEIAFGGTLTANLNALLATFYRPHANRRKILCESKAFPSDNYSFQSQVRLHNGNPKEDIILVHPRSGEYTINTEDIIETLRERGQEISVVVFSAVQFYTGQLFDIPQISAEAHKQGCIVGWDLAHASGNVELKLHDWGVDFAVFCSYKYLNCGPGNLGGLFVHDRLNSDDRPRPAGWWGVDERERFEMNHYFRPMQGARGFSQSNVCFFGPPCMHSSLDAIETAGGMKELTKRSRSLTGYLYELLRKSPYHGDKFEIMTSDDEKKRGSQLSLIFFDDILNPLLIQLEQAGIIGDERKPNVIRWAPSSLYNTHEECLRAVETLNKLLSQL